MTPEEYSAHLDALEVQLARLWPYPLDGTEASSIDEWLTSGASWGLVERAVAITVARYERKPRPTATPIGYLIGVLRNLVERAEARGE